MNRPTTWMLVGLAAAYLVGNISGLGPFALALATLSIAIPVALRELGRLHDHDELQLRGQRRGAVWAFVFVLVMAPIYASLPDQRDAFAGRGLEAAISLFALVYLIETQGAGRGVRSLLLVGAGLSFACGLSHLPNFDKGLKEVMRVTKKYAVVAIPTILNPCSLVQVGGGQFYIKGPRSFLALPIGFIKMLWALVTMREGVDEGYEGRKELEHIFRFPWVMKRKIKKCGFKLVSYEAPSICLPYFEALLPIIKILDKYRTSKIFRNLGYGTGYLIEK